MSNKKHTMGEYIGLLCALTLVGFAMFTSAYTGFDSSQIYMLLGFVVITLLYVLIIFVPIKAVARATLTRLRAGHKQPSPQPQSDHVQGADVQ